MEDFILCSCLSNKQTKSKEKERKKKTLSSLKWKHHCYNKTSLSSHDTNHMLASKCNQATSQSHFGSMHKVIGSPLSEDWNADKGSCGFCRFHIKWLPCANNSPLGLRLCKPSLYFIHCIQWAGKKCKSCFVFALKRSEKSQASFFSLEEVVVEVTVRSVSTMGASQARAPGGHMQGSVLVHGSCTRGIFVGQAELQE